MSTRPTRSRVPAITELDNEPRKNPAAPGQPQDTPAPGDAEQPPRPGHASITVHADTAAEADAAAEAPADAPEQAEEAAPQRPPVRTPTGGRVTVSVGDSGPAGAYPGAMPGVPRLPGAEMSPALRQRWRHMLRSQAGKLAAAYRAAAQAEDEWMELVADARNQNVPGGMVTAAMADAGLPTDAPA